VHASLSFDVRSEQGMRTSCATAAESICRRGRGARPLPRPRADIRLKAIPPGHLPRTDVVELEDPRDHCDRNHGCCADSSGPVRRSRMTWGPHTVRRSPGERAVAGGAFATGSSSRRPRRPRDACRRGARHEEFRRLEQLPLGYTREHLSVLQITMSISSTSRSTQ
jgi:hypothetical protein